MTILLVIMEGATACMASAATLMRSVVAAKGLGGAVVALMSIVVL